MPGQVLSIFDAYVYPRKKFKTKFDVFSPFVFVLTIVSVCAVLIKPLGLFEEDQRYVVISSSVKPMGLELFKRACGDGGIYVGGRPGAGLCTSFPFPVFA